MCVCGDAALKKLGDHLWSNFQSFCFSFSDLHHHVFSLGLSTTFCKLTFKSFLLLSFHLFSAVFSVVPLSSLSEPHCALYKSSPLSLSLSLTPSQFLLPFPR